MKIKKILVVSLLTILMLLSFSGCSGTSNKSVTLAELAWDTSLVGNRIAGFILEHGYGYDVEIVPGETIPLWEGLRRGDVDVQLEVFPQTQLKAYNEAMAEGSVVKLGNTFSTTEGWYVPTYMIDEGLLPQGFSIEDMPDYWQLFKDPENPNKGVLYSGAPGWEAEKTTSIKFETFGLDEYYNMFPTGSDAAQIASMASAYEKSEPWLGYYWEPSWPLAQFDMTRVTEPVPYDPNLWEPDRACDWPLQNNETACNAEWAETVDKDILEFLRNYNTSTEVCNAYLLYMYETGADAETTAMWYFSEFEDIWTQWVPADVAEKVKDAMP